MHGGKKWLQPGVSEIVTRKISASKCARYLTVYNISSMHRFTERLRETIVPHTQDAQEILIRTHRHNNRHIVEFEEKSYRGRTAEMWRKNVVPAAKSHALRFTKGSAPS